MRVELNYRTKLALAAAAILVLLVGGLVIYHRAYQAGRAAQAVTNSKQRIKEAKQDAKDAEKRGDGGWLYRDIIARSRRNLPR